MAATQTLGDFGQRKIYKEVAVAVLPLLAACIGKTGPVKKKAIEQLGQRGDICVFRIFEKCLRDFDMAILATLPPRFCVYHQVLLLCERFIKDMVLKTHFGGRRSGEKSDGGSSTTPASRYKLL